MRLNRLFTMTLLAISLVACQPADAPATERPVTSILDGYLPATLVASRWDSRAYLSFVGSDYAIVEGQPVLKRVSYVFTLSPDGRSATYLGVNISAAGRLETGLPAGSAFPPAHFALAEVNIGEADALRLGWEALGGEIEEACGPVERVLVAGSAASADPWWSVTYWRQGVDLSVWLDANTGELIEIEPVVCVEN